MTAPLQYGTPQDSDPTAVMGRRTLAWIADLVLFLAVVAAGFASMSEYTTIPTGVAEAEACDLFDEQNPGAADSCIAYDGDIYLLDTGESGVQTLLSFGWFAFFVVLQGLTGGSPGKLLFGLRVVDQYGAKAGIGKSLGRTLLWVVDAAPWIIPLVGPITAFTSSGHRRVGDLAAGTYVVSSSRVGQPVRTEDAPIPAGQPAWGAGPPTAPPPAGPGVQTAPPRDGRWESPAAEVEDPADGWEPPTIPGAAPPPEPPPFAAPGADGPPTAPPPTAPRHELPPPQWDAARGTYIQWEPNRQAWLQWDASGERWKPIDT